MSLVYSNALKRLMELYGYDLFDDFSGTTIGIEESKFEKPNIPLEEIHPDACSPEWFGCFDETSSYCKECQISFPECAKKCKTLTKPMKKSEPVIIFHEEITFGKSIYEHPIIRMREPIPEPMEFSSMGNKQFHWSTKKHKNKEFNNYYLRKKK